MGDTKLDTVVETTTIVDDPVASAPDTHREGWLTMEAYVAWVAGTEGVFLSDRPLASPMPFKEPTEDAEPVVESECRAA